MGVLTLLASTQPAQSYRTCTTSMCTLLDADAGLAWAVAVGGRGGGELFAVLLAAYATAPERWSPPLLCARERGMVLGHGSECEAAWDKGKGRLGALQRPPAALETQTISETPTNPLPFRASCKVRRCEHSCCVAGACVALWRCGYGIDQSINLQGCWILERKKTFCVLCMAP